MTSEPRVIRLQPGEGVVVDTEGGVTVEPSATALRFAWIAGWDDDRYTTPGWRVAKCADGGWEVTVGQVVPRGTVR